MKPEPVKFPKSLKWSKLRDDEIAEQLGCHPSTVFKHRKLNGLPQAPRKPGSGAKPRINRSKINFNKTARWNADKLDASYNWMTRIMREERKARGITKRGAVKTKKPKVSEEDVW